MSSRFIDMSYTQPEKAPLPTFHSNHQINTLPHFYFHHIINEKDATLTVEVTGANLCHIFTHSRAKQLMSASVIKSALDRKTVGFSTLAHGSNRHIMAWAESGHGSGRTGDVLDADAPVLHNTLWTKRTIHVGTILGLAMARPFDKMGRYQCANQGDLRGVFQGAHVEAKLAVHAVYLMLRHFKVTKDLNNITLADLRALQEARFKNGQKPAFEIYFSRENCKPCGKIVLRLVEITGIDIKLNWRHRLTRMVYNKPTRSAQKKAMRNAILIEDDQAVDFEDVVIIEDDNVSDDDTVDGSSVRKAIAIEVDPTRDSASRRLIDEEAFIGEMQSYVLKVDGASSVPTDAQLPRQQRQQRHSAQQCGEPRDIPKPFPPTPVTKLPEELVINSVPRLSLRYERVRAVRKEAARLSRVRERSHAPYGVSTGGRDPPMRFHVLKKQSDKVGKLTPKLIRNRSQARFADVLPILRVFAAPNQTHRGDEFQTCTSDDDYDVDRLIEHNEEVGDELAMDDTPSRGMRKATIISYGGAEDEDECF